MRSPVLVLLLFSLCLSLPGPLARADELRGMEETVVWATWQSDPTTTLTVHWINDDPPADSEGAAVPTVTIRGLDDDVRQELAGTTRAIPGTERFVHHAEAVGLTPGAGYEVRVPGDPRPRKFRTLDADADTPLRFLSTACIYRKRSIVMQMHGHVADRKPDFALFVGDIAYANGLVENADKWLDFLWGWDTEVVTEDGFSVPTIGVIGNHEVEVGYGGTLEQAPFFHLFYPFPGERPYGVLDIGEDLSLVLLDSGHLTPIGGEQTRWLEETLAPRADRMHLFTAWHVPAFPAARRFGSKYPSQVRKHFVPLLDRYGVDVAFEGHDHAYKRSQPIRHGDVDPLGTLYVGDGGYGDNAERKPWAPGNGGWFSDRRWYLANSAQVDHFQIITLTGPKRVFEAVGTDGKTFDTWTHVGNEPKPVVETPRTPVPARAEFWLIGLGVPAVVAFGVWWTQFTRARRARLAA